MLSRQVQGTVEWYITSLSVLVLTVPDAIIVTCGAPSSTTSIHPQADNASSRDSIFQVQSFE